MYLPNRGTRKANFGAARPYESCSSVLIRDLKAGTTRNGSVLKGRLVTEAIKMQSVQTVLEDEIVAMLLRCQAVWCAWRLLSLVAASLAKWAVCDSVSMHQLGMTTRPPAPLMSSETCIMILVAVVHHHSEVALPTPRGRPPASTAALPGILLDAQKRSSCRNMRNAPRGVLASTLSGCR
jgi:hypothetical protein